MLQPRPLNTQNRLLAVTTADRLSVRLGRAAQEISQTPMFTGLIGQALEQTAAASSAITEEQRTEFYDADRERIRRQGLIEQEMALETDPVKYEGLRSSLDQIYGERETQKNIFFEQAVQAGRLVSPEELREQFGDLLEFSDDHFMAPAEVELLYDNKKAEIIRNAIISRSPSGFIPGVAKFGAGMLAMATDPLEFSLMFVPFVGPGSRAASIAKYGKTLGRAKTGAIEGAGGAILIEPLVYNMSKQQQLDYTMTEALFNVGAGAALGGILSPLTAAFARKLGKIGKDDTLNLDDIESEIRADMASVDLPVRESASNVFKARRLKKQQKALKVNYETALRQVINDQGVRVDVLIPNVKASDRPVDILTFIKQRGGINDNDPTFRGELKNLEINPVSGYMNAKTGKMVYRSESNPASKNNLDDMADAAFQAGYIDARNTNLLMEAIGATKRGDPIFAREDLEMAESWRKANNSVSEAEAEASMRSDIRQDLDENGIKEVSDEELALTVYEMSESGADALAAYAKISNMGRDAASRMASQQKDLQAQELAKYAESIESDPFADVQAAERFESSLDELNLDDEIPRLEYLVLQSQERGELMEYQIQDIRNQAKIDEEAEAYSDLSKKAAACMAVS